MKYLAIIAVLAVSFSCGAEGGFEIPRSTTVELRDPSSDRIYPLFIKLPRSYSSNLDRQYPVVYLTDARYSFQLASGATRLPMNSGAMQEAILVGISYAKGSRGASSRVRDYTHVKDADWKMETGGAEAHASFIRNSVFPFIDSTYRTDASQRTFVGNSLGGLFGAFMLFSHPDMFSSYILGSPSVWYRDKHILSLPVAKADPAVSVYLSVGSLETLESGEGEAMVAGAKQLADKIAEQSHNVEMRFSIIDGARHETAFPTTLVQGLDWLYGKNP